MVKHLWYFFPIQLYAREATTSENSEERKRDVDEIWRLMNSEPAKKKKIENFSEKKSTSLHSLPTRDFTQASSAEVGHYASFFFFFKTRNYMVGCCWIVLI